MQSIVLEPLGDYGGATQTFALPDDSPAIDFGTEPCPAVDQRGVSRTAPCDSGAFELR